MIFDTGSGLPRLYFVHLAKTGGTSLRFLLRHAYGKKAYFPAAHLDALVLGMQTAPARYRCFGGHFGRAIYSLLPPNYFDATVTILRDPVERALSQVAYVTRLATHRPWAALPSEHASLATWQPFLKQEGDLDAGWLSEQQTRILGVDFDLQPYLRLDLSQRASRIELREAYQRALTTADPDKAFPVAQEFLRSCAVVGVTERFGETARLLCDLIGVRPPATWPDLNRAPQTETAGQRSHRASGRYPPHVLARLEELTVRDRALYAQANEMLDEQMAAYRARPRRSYHWLPSARVWGATTLQTVLERSEPLLRRAADRVGMRSRLAPLWRKLKPKA